MKSCKLFFKLQVNATNVTHVSAPNPFLTDTRRRPKMTLSSLDIEIDGSTFEHGSAHLKCVANVFSLYRKEVEFVLDEERPRPRPSSVLGTRDTASGEIFAVKCFLYMASQLKFSHPTISDFVLV